MSASHRLPTASVLALALLTATSPALPAGAQEQPQQRFQQHVRPQQGQQHGQQHGQPQRQQFQQPQEAQRRRGGNGAGIAAGVIGGLAAGALLGGALSDRGGYAEPGYADEGGPRYGGGCPLVRRPVYDGAGQFAGYQSVPSC